MISARQVSDPVLDHGEGAVWFEELGALRCVDMFRGDVLTFHGECEIERHHLGALAAMVRPAGPGLSIVAREGDVVLWHEDSGRVEQLVGDFISPHTRLNEGGCTPRGDLLIGSMHVEHRAGAGSLFRVRGDGTVTTVATGVGISNGLGFNAAGSRAFYIDSFTRRVDIFTVTNDEQLIERRPFTELPPGDFGPDGLWVDADDGVWVALYGGHRVEHYLADGQLAETVHVGAAQVTSCAFGGSDLSTLFITTSRENLRPGEDPLAGSVFAAEVAARGQPALPFLPNLTQPPSPNPKGDTTHKGTP